LGVGGDSGNKNKRRDRNTSMNRITKNVRLFSMVEVSKTRSDRGVVQPLVRNISFHNTKNLSRVTI
jgi:hypothetical protein